MMDKPKLLFYFPGTVNAKGMSGIGFRVWRAVSLLKSECDITVMVFDTPDWDLINSIYDTRISDGDVKIIITKRTTVWRRFRSCLACYGPIDPVLGKAAKENDLCVGFYNFTHFGVPGVHFLAGFDVFNVIGIKGPRVEYWSSVVDFRDFIAKKLRYFAHCFMFFLKKVLHRDQQFLNTCRSNGDIIVANSEWMASFFSGTKLEVQVLYPPVASEFCYRSFENRTNAFVCLGRIHEIKKIENMVRILSEVRRRTQIPFDFYIAGYFENRAYCRFIKKLIARYDWIKLVGRVSGREKEELLTSCKYAIHACNIEAFGIAVAEFIKAGCIPFVPDDGGASEIVNNKELCFDNDSDAVDKIVSVLKKEDCAQCQIQKSLLRRGELFTLDNFDKGFLSIVNKKLVRQGFTAIRQNDDSFFPS